MNEKFFFLVSEICMPRILNPQMLIIGKQVKIVETKITIFKNVLHGSWDELLLHL